ncbi:MAG: SRPBCC family protein [Acidobacteria bacterium]|nr:SRPBCC family protein [Acidobacteriota bacterium]
MALNFLLNTFADALATGDRPNQGIQVIHEETLVPASLEETFAFFSDAANLERLTPTWLNFRIRSTTPLTMRAGLEIDYVIGLRGFPIPWKTRIDVWEPGVRFVDRQVNGPYLWWHHEHRFEEAIDGTRVIDHVEFVPRLRWITGGFVRRDVEKIFQHRGVTLRQIFAAEHHIIELGPEQKSF